jgi:hypothetical protein
MERYGEVLADFDHAFVLGVGSYNSRGLIFSYLEIGKCL